MRPWRKLGLNLATADPFRLPWQTHHSAGQRNWGQSELAREGIFPAPNFFAREHVMEKAAIEACRKNLAIWEMYLNGIAQAMRRPRRQEHLTRPRPRCRIVLRE